MPLFDSISHDRQRRSCVVDPALALSKYGVPLMRQLGKALELWVGRELWHILDHSTLYSQQPELVTPKGCFPTRSPEQERKALQETLWALREWEQFRLKNDLVGLNLFWLGDNPRESFLPKDRDLELFWRWEAIANSLDAQSHQPPTKDYILPLAFRDAIALSICLGSAFILTYQSSAEADNNCPPEICKMLETWRIPCQRLTSQNAVVATERHYLHQLFAYTDAAKVLWSGVRLAVLHLLAPMTTLFQEPSELSQLNSLSLSRPFATNQESPSNLWVEVQGFWYLI